MTTVTGTSTTGVGVSGYSASGFGISGTASRPWGTGVGGDSPEGFGVYATSARGVAVLAIAGATPASGGVRTGGLAARFVGPVIIQGPLTVTDLNGLQQPRPPGTLAASFDGAVVVQGDFTVMGGHKNAAVPHPDGTHRLFRAIESPESWFEDFGEGALVNGGAEVQFDSEFAQFVETGRYHVFLTPYGESNGLYVADRSRTGFRVREQNRGTSHVAFSYRIVALRKDVAPTRLEKFKAPAPYPHDALAVSEPARAA